MSATQPTDVLTPDLQRATETDEVLHIWAKALGPPTALAQHSMSYHVEIGGPAP